MTRKKSLLVLASLSLAACSSIGTLDDHPNPADTEEEAGSVHIAVLSAGLWDNYRDKLQPKFALNEAQALDAAISTTRTTQDSVLDALRLGVQVSPSASTRSSSTTTTGAEDGTSSTTSTATQQEGPQSTSAPPPPAVTSLPTNLRAPPFVDPGSAAVNASLRYEAATALFEEVQLLNRYIEDIAVRDDYVAYVVRVQISVMPNGRNRPYDTYANVSFLWNPTDQVRGDSVDGSDSAVVDAADTLNKHFNSPGKNRPGTEDMNGSLKFDRLRQAAATVANTLAVHRGIEVVPILVTDDLETTAHSSVADQLRQLEFALSILTPTVGAGASLQQVAEKMRKIVGSDMNSLLTVARLTDNTIRVRLGAQQAVDTQYAMVPRTHNVSLAVLVKRNNVADSGVDPISREVEVVLRSEFRSVNDGKPLPGRDWKVKAKTLNDVADRVCEYAHIKGGDVPPLPVDLLDYVRRNDIENFDKDPRTKGLISKCKLDKGVLWAELAALQIQFPEAIARFELPLYEGIKSPDWLQLSPLLDDGKAPKVTLWSDRRLPSKANSIDYSLCVDTHCGSKTVCDYVVPGTESPIAGSSYRQMEIKFPPLLSVTSPISRPTFDNTTANAPTACPATVDAAASTNPKCDAQHPRSCKYSGSSWNYSLIARWDELARDVTQESKDWKAPLPFRQVDVSDRFNAGNLCTTRATTCGVARLSYTQAKLEDKPTFSASTGANSISQDEHHRGRAIVRLEIKDAKTKVLIASKGADIVAISGSIPGCVKLIDKGWQASTSCVLTMSLENLFNHFDVSFTASGEEVSFKQPDPLEFDVTPARDRRILN